MRRTAYPRLRSSVLDRSRGSGQASPGLRRGFTLIEILIVIGIIAILTGIVMGAVNPARMLAQARNTARWSGAEAILTALNQYAIGHSGGLPSGIPTDGPKGICRSGALTCVNGVDLSALTQNGAYLVALPVDPQAPLVGTGTLYTVVFSSGSRLTVAAPNAELEEVISLTR